MEKSASISSNAGSLIKTKPIFTKGIDPTRDSNQGIDWESILPNLKPYSLKPKQSNYDAIPKQARVINFQDIMKNNQKETGYRNLALPTPLSQKMNLGYKSNQAHYSLAA